MTDAPENNISRNAINSNLCVKKHDFCDNFQYMNTSHILFAGRTSGFYKNETMEKTNRCLGAMEDQHRSACYNIPVIQTNGLCP